jgi:hypothetical protein
MDDDDINDIQEMINEYGARDVLQGFILALQQSADDMSDLGFKELAMGRANMAELLQKADANLEE